MLAHMATREGKVTKEVEGTRIASSSTRTPTLPDAVAMAPGRSGATITDVYLTGRR
jgi:hypothetical protein